MIDMSLELLNSDKEIVSMIMKELTAKLNKKLPPMVDRISKRLQFETFNYLQATETYQSLLHGELAGHFGIPTRNRERNLDTIISTISNNIVVEYKPIRYTKGKFTNGITILVLLKDFSDIFNLPISVIFSEEGEPLEWLRWLLKSGNHIVIKGYDVAFILGKGRSGMAVMIEENASSWRVPLEFAGTARNNWLTRAINKNATQYTSIIYNIVKQELRGS